MALLAADCCRLQCAATWSSLAPLQPCGVASLEYCQGPWAENCGSGVAHGQAQVGEALPVELGTYFHSFTATPPPQSYRITCCSGSQAAPGPKPSHPPRPHPELCAAQSTAPFRLLRRCPHFRRLLFRLVCSCISSSLLPSLSYLAPISLSFSARCVGASARLLCRERPARLSPR